MSYFEFKSFKFKRLVIPAGEIFLFFAANNRLFKLIERNRNENSDYSNAAIYRTVKTMKFMQMLLYLSKVSNFSTLSRAIVYQGSTVSKVKCCNVVQKQILFLFFICFDKPEAISDNPLVEIFQATQIRQSKSLRASFKSNSEFYFKHDPCGTKTKKNLFGTCFCCFGFSFHF